MEKRFYVYIYLDPRKPGKYEYEVNDMILELDYEPFYVGKGTNRRCFLHWYFFKNLPNRFMKGKLSHIAKEKLAPIIFLRDSLIEEKALRLEEDLIESIGRIQLKKGPLCNLTNGGEGISGRIQLEDQKKNHSEKMKMIWKNPEFIKKRKKIDKNSETRKKRSEAAKKQGENLEFRKEKSMILKALWKNPEFRKKKSKSQSKYMKERCNDPEYKEQFSAEMKKRWEDPEYRKMISGKIKEGWESPECKERASARMKKRWEDPEYRKRICKKQKERWRRRKENERSLSS